MDFYYTINSYDKNTTVILSKQYVMHTRIVIKFFSTLNIRKLYRIKYITFYFYTQIFRWIIWSTLIFNINPYTFENKMFKLVVYKETNHAIQIPNSAIQNNWRVLFERKSLRSHNPVIDTFFRRYKKIQSSMIHKTTYVLLTAREDALSHGAVCTWFERNHVLLFCTKRSDSKIVTFILNY